MMNIEIKNLKIAKSLSEETLAFTATVYVNGKAAFHASNHGTGGCNSYHPIAPATYADIRAADDWVKANTSHDFEPLDCYLGDLIDGMERRKVLDRMLKSKITVMVDNKGQPALATYPAKYKPTPANIAAVAARLKAGEQVVNGNAALMERALALV